MSAQGSEYPGEAPVIRYDAITMLAPKMQAALLDGLERCHLAGLDAVTFETYRSPATQLIYFARGRTQRPPAAPVTNAQTNLLSWHGYGLAADIISKAHAWDAGDDWFHQMAECMLWGGLLKWGGDFTTPDLPHIQWGRCKASPSDQARSIYAAQGESAVWLAVGAAEAPQ